MADVRLEQYAGLLRTGLRLSQQGSYHRREPDAKARPYLADARDGLRELSAEDPTNAGAWRLLSQAEEALLDYGAAIDALQRALCLSETRNKRDLKRLALLREALSEWTALPLEPSQLAELGAYLREQALGPEDRSLRWTRAWLERHDIKNSDEVLRALGRRGAFSDFRVLSNIV
jgi:tetratricopeptide (TPR) repeat protein